MCQGCVNAGSLSQATYDRIQAFNEEWPDAEWGPAHTVLSDCNVYDAHIQGCLVVLRATRARSTVGLEEWQAKLLDAYLEHEDAEHEAVEVFLSKLLEVPEDVR